MKIYVNGKEVEPCKKVKLDVETKKSINQIIKEIKPKEPNSNRGKEGGR